MGKTTILSLLKIPTRCLDLKFYRMWALNLYLIPNLITVCAGKDRFNQKLEATCALNREAFPGDATNT